MSTEEQIKAYEASPLTDEAMHLVRRPPNVGVFFPGRLLTLPHVYPDSKVEAKWHDVINLPEFNEGRTIHGKNCARWAIIFFANSMFAGEISKTLTHTGVVEAVKADPEQTELVA